MLQTPSIAAIVAAVASHFHITTTQLLASRRATARPRQVAMWIATEATLLSLPQIGRAFRRDRTTIMHARSVINGLLDDGDPTGTAAQALLASLTRRAAA